MKARHRIVRIEVCERVGYNHRAICRIATKWKGEV